MSLFAKETKDVVQLSYKQLYFDLEDLIKRPEITQDARLRNKFAEIQPYVRSLAYPDSGDTCESCQ